MLFGCCNNHIVTLCSLPGAWVDESHIYGEHFCRNFCKEKEEMSHHTQACNYKQLLFLGSLK